MMIIIITQTAAIALEPLTTHPDEWGDIIYKLRTKHSQLNDTLENFVCTTPNCHVMLAMYKTAFHVCEGLLHNQAFLVQFGSVLSLKTSYHRLGMLCGGTGYVAAG